jgi:hypothetical protein
MALLAQSSSQGFQCALLGYARFDLCRRPVDGTFRDLLVGYMYLLA